MSGMRDSSGKAMAASCVIAVYSRKVVERERALTDFGWIAVAVVIDISAV
jgi:hypothetical protein